MDKVPCVTFLSSIDMDALSNNLLSLLPPTQSWNLPKVGISHLVNYVYRCATKLTDALNQTHDVFDFDSSTNLANKHVCKVFLKSMSCLICDFYMIGFFLSLQKPMMWLFGLFNLEFQLWVRSSLVIWYKGQLLCCFSSSKVGESTIYFTRSLNLKDHILAHTEIGMKRIPNCDLVILGVFLRGRRQRLISKAHSEHVEPIHATMAGRPLGYSHPSVMMSYRGYI